MLKMNSAPMKTYFTIPISYFSSRSILSLLPSTGPKFSNCGQPDVENEFSDPENIVFDIHIAHSFRPLPSVSQFSIEGETNAKKLNKGSLKTHYSMPSCHFCTHSSLQTSTPTAFQISETSKNHNFEHLVIEEWGWGQKIFKDEKVWK